jgi:cytoskeleton protein RodZ
VGEFGDKFRKAREKKELSFDDVSNVTKIGSRMLQAIEEEHFDQLPGGVFNKGFIRAYAKHLGLNDEEAVTDYLTCLRQAQVDAHEVWEPKHPTPPPRPPALEKNRAGEPKLPPLKPQAPTQVEELPELQLPRSEDVRPRRKAFADGSPEIPWRLIAVAALVVVLAVTLWTRRSHHATAAAASTSPAKTVQASNTSPSPASLSGSTPAPRSQAPQSAAVSATPAHSPASNSQPPQNPLPLAATLSPSSAPASSSAELADKNDVTVRSSAKPNAKPPQKSAPSLTLVIRATETSWISVLADGQAVSQETLIAPAHTSVRANREIIAKVGNAAGVTFLWNGQEIRADGAESEVKTFIFDSTGMHVAPTSQPAPNN